HTGEELRRARRVRPGKALGAQIGCRRRRRGGDSAVRVQQRVVQPGKLLVGQHLHAEPPRALTARLRAQAVDQRQLLLVLDADRLPLRQRKLLLRSEERRVGKEYRSRCVSYYLLHEIVLCYVSGPS